MSSKRKPNRKRRPADQAATLTEALSLVATACHALRDKLDSVQHALERISAKVES